MHKATILASSHTHIYAVKQAISNISNIKRVLTLTQDESL